LAENGGIGGTGPRGEGGGAVGGGKNEKFKFRDENFLTPSTQLKKDEHLSAGRSGSPGGFSNVRKRGRGKLPGSWLPQVARRGNSDRDGEAGLASHVLLGRSKKN